MVARASEITVKTGFKFIDLSLLFNVSLTQNCLPLGLGFPICKMELQQNKLIGF